MADLEKLLFQNVQAFSLSNLAQLLFTYYTLIEKQANSKIIQVLLAQTLTSLKKAKESE